MTDEAYCLLKIIDVIFEEVFLKSFERFERNAELVAQFFVNENNESIVKVNLRPCLILFTAFGKDAFFIPAIQLAVT